MPDETKEQIATIVDTLNRIERCLTGDAKMGQRGVFERLDNHSARIKRLERWVAYLTAATGVIVIIYNVLTDWLPHK